MANQTIPAHAAQDLAALPIEALAAEHHRVEHFRPSGCYGPDSYVGIGYSDLGILFALNVDGDDVERVVAATVYDPTDWRREFAGIAATPTSVLNIAQGLHAGIAGTAAQREEFAREVERARASWQKQAGEYWAEFRAGV